MKRQILFCFFCLLPFSAEATCLLGDAYVEKGRIGQAKEAYLVCSQKADVDANYALGEIFRDGKAGEKDLYKSLFYFRFAAENGLAKAQRELAKTMFLLKRQGEEGLEILKKYEEKMRQIKSKYGQSDEDIYAYTWLLLAAENAENKWYYSAPAQQDAQAVYLYNSMKKRLTKEEENKVLRQAAAFKEEKLILTAQSVLNQSEFEQFKAALFPKKGEINQKKLAFEITKLKGKVEKFLNPKPQQENKKENLYETESNVFSTEKTGRLDFVE